MVWFKRLGPVFGPVSVAGRVLGLVALGFCRQVFLVVDGKSHSVATLFLACFHTGLQHFSVGLGSPKRTRDSRESGSSELTQRDGATCQISN